MPIRHLLQCAGSSQCHQKEHVMSTCLAHKDPLVPVQVFCMHSEPNYSLPWQRKRQFSSTSSGFVISGRRILTNAHSVDHHTQARHFTYHTSCPVWSLGHCLLRRWFSCHSTAPLIWLGHMQVKVRQRGSDTKFVAAVLAVGTECDIGRSPSLDHIDNLLWSRFIASPTCAEPVHGGLW